MLILPSKYCTSTNWELIRIIRETNHALSKIIFFFILNNLNIFLVERTNNNVIGININIAAGTP